MSCKVAALLTSHERCLRTLACLTALTSQEPAEHLLEVVLVDAGSTDGTADAVGERFPGATVIRCGTEVHWNQGMRLALARARREEPDHYLWLNDDVILDRDALAALLRTERMLRERTGRPAIIVGTTRDPEGGYPTYGAVRRPERRRPLRFRLVPPTDEPRPAETMNGNCVLIPREVVEIVGDLEARFSHGMGDFDYGLRARSAGVEVWIAPGTVGTCPRNPKRSRSVRQEARYLTSPKGIPPREWLLFVRRWGGPFWPLYFVSPYIRRILRTV